MNIINIFSKEKNKVEASTLLEESWNKPIVFAIGGLTAIGFYEKWNYLLVVSHQGRSVIDCDSMAKVARDNNQLLEGDLNELERTIKGIGPLKNKNIHCVGLWGGNLAQSTQDGWLVEVQKNEIVLVKGSDNEIIQFPQPITELRAAGFSTDGEIFVYATSSEIMFFSKTNNDKKEIMSCLPLLEKSYYAPRRKDDDFMYEVILLACNWGRLGWLDLALNWIDQGFKIDRIIINALEKLLNSEILPQKYKHREYAKVKKWKVKNYIYIDVKWIHDNHDEPIRLVSELDEERSEVRKFEYYIDGTVNYAEEDNNTGDTRLGIVEVSSLSEINLDKEFDGMEISKAEFDSLWFKGVKSDES